MTGVRMDVWLWAARFFKTRAIAKRACEIGRIKSNGHPAKPAREVRVGDRLDITNDAGASEWTCCCSARCAAPAAVAQTLYRETDASIEARQRAAEERKAMPQFELGREGRPSKRDRRRIVQFRGRS